MRHYRSALGDFLTTSADNSRYLGRIRLSACWNEDASRNSHTDKMHMAIVKAGICHSAIQINKLRMPIVVRIYIDAHNNSVPDQQIAHAPVGIYVNRPIDEQRPF